MGGIAAGVRADGAKFYWHLGDFRAGSDFDQDLLAAPEYRGKHLSISDYQRIKWSDFISQQIEPFGDVPVYLAIGNHELVAPTTRADYLQQFADWLDSPTLRAQRLRDDPHDHKLRTYYDWMQSGIDFIQVSSSMMHSLPGSSAYLRVMKAMRAYAQWWLVCMMRYPTASRPGTA